ncbi:MAG: GNAT family N-acetyltransferase [Steroidobacteraceae bacterium]
MQPSPTHILPATTDSIPVLVELMRQYWEFEQIRGFSGECAQTLLQSFLSQPQLGRGWIACNEQQILGYLLCSRVFSFEYGGLTAAIDEVYVVSEARGQGVGKMLVRAAETEMRDQGCIHIEMEVAARNVRAQRFYSLLGFTTRAGYSMMHKALTG